MSDITQGQDAPSDASLFQEVTEATTLEKFENPPLPKEDPKPAEPKPGEKIEPKVEPKVEPKTEAEPAVPAGRLREEAEARRRAERERDELYARLAANQPRQQQLPQRKDVFDDPSAFVQEEIRPYLEHLAAQAQRDRENFSLDWAKRNFGDDKVHAARVALEQGMQRGDESVWNVYRRAMQSHDPYGVITRAHLERERLNAVGDDLEAYNKRILDEAMKDPEFLKRATEAARGLAATSGNSVARSPATTQSKVPVMPSLSNIGAGGGDEQIVEPSDEQLFRAAVSAKRR